MAVCVHNEDEIPWHDRTESQKKKSLRGLDLCVTNKNVEKSSQKFDQNQLRSTAINH